MKPMELALSLARKATAMGEIPVGAVVVDGRTSDILAACHNLTESSHDPTAHAEILAIREAAQKHGDARLTGCDLYVTLEPCTMCAGAIAHARLRRVYYGAADPKGGGIAHGARFFSQPTCHHRPEIYGGLSESESAELLRDFFQSRR